MIDPNSFYEHMAANSDAFLTLMVGIVILLVGLALCDRRWRLFRAKSILPSPPIWAVMSIATLLRLPRMTDALWYDESFTANMAALPTRHLMTAVLGDVHPPLWYLLSSATTRILGNSEIALRSPSLLAGIVGVYLVYRLTRAMKLDKKSAEFAALITALMPAHIMYSNEARSYAFMVVLVAVMLIAWAENRPRWFAVSASVLALTHVIGLVYIAVFWILSRFASRAKLRKWRTTWMTVAGISGVWLPYIWVQSGDVADGFWIAPLRVGDVFYPLLTMTVTGRMPTHLTLWAFIPFVIALLMSVAFSYRFVKSSGLTLVGLLLGVPSLLALISYFLMPVYLPRSLLPVTVIGASVFIGQQLANERKSLIIAILTLPSIAVALLGYFSDSADRFDFSNLLSTCNGSKIAYYTGIPAAMIGRYYLDVPSVIWSGANDINQTLPDYAKTAFGFNQVDNANGVVGDICLLAFETPMTRSEERDHIAEVINSHRVIDVRFEEVNDFYYVTAFLLENE